MKSSPAAIPDLLTIEPTVFSDARGFFYESFNQKAFNEATGLNFKLFQDSHTRNTMGR